ncbi:hypothetical protein MN210_14265 [Psychrobacter raelei]|uniref:GNAT family N-acetyltransferase n=1 Tax=Psychrobacter raelei TaxID=2565531 RepID=A0AAT9PE92_9GAMM|nr:hypothetical protein [Psychrobacter sp. PraFG1]UNK05138.1 hypothetical protein MN210_14265 [Psychrobacter sp. PraFG1]
MSKKYTIDLPVTDTWLGSNNPFSNSKLFEISSESDVELRDILESFARYFKEEMHYDNVQYYSNSHKSNLVGYLFRNSALDVVTEEHTSSPTRWFGGCLFEYENDEWTLCWVWLHPFFRNRGELSTAWKEFKDKYGDFKVQKPLSAQMEKFLSKEKRY